MRGMESLTYRAVEFVGGPVDGLRLVSGIEEFGLPDPEREELLFSIDPSGAKYVRRKVSEGVLYLDVCPELT